MSDTSTVAQNAVDPFAYTAVSSLQYADAEKVQINAVVTFVGLGAVPFTLCATDPTAHGAALYAAAMAGDFGSIADFQAPADDVLDTLARHWRDSELAGSQWLVERHRDQIEAGSSTTLAATQYSALQAYRQALRDWPMLASFPAPASKPAAPDWLGGVGVVAD